LGGYPPSIQCRDSSGGRYTASLLEKQPLPPPPPPPIGYFVDRKTHFQRVEKYKGENGKKMHINMCRV
jgi:hypothetical protein